MHDLAKIRDDVIKRGFLELISTDVQVEWRALEDALMEYGGLTEEGYYVEVDESLKGVDDKEIIEGGLAHEFAHIIADIRMQTRAVITRDRWARRISKEYRRLDERNTDLEVLIRGFGMRLLKFLRYAEAEGYPYYKENGLSIREVESILTQAVGSL